MNRIDVYKSELKLLLSFVYTIVLTVVTVYILYLIYSLSIRANSSLNDTIFKLRYAFDFDIIKYCIFFIVLIFYFNLIFSKKISYYLEITNSIKHISDGNFGIRIPVKNKDTLGSLAYDINSIMNRFNYAIEEERKSEQTKIDLITSISHDLRTPLTSILGYMQLIDDDKYKDEVTLRYYANIALTKTKRLKVLIDDLFELTTLNNYGLKITKTKLNIVELINQLAIEYRLVLRKAGMECRLYFPEEKVYVLGDSIKLVRAFENLISNCIKYSKSSRYIDISVNKNYNIAILEFINYGEPIPPADIPYVFQRFYRVEKSRGEVTGGSGLGLAIAKNIIELHDGKIGVESNIERTIFRIELPIAM